MKALAVDLVEYLIGFAARACKAIPLVALFLVFYVLTHSAPINYYAFDYSIGVVCGMAIYFMVWG